MSAAALASAQEMAIKVVDALGGYGIFGVEYFVKGDEVIFSELSPRPHDTGMVTLISQSLSEFDLHARAILGLPIPAIELSQASASARSSRTRSMRFGDGSPSSPTGAGRCGSTAVSWSSARPWSGSRSAV